MSTPPTTTHDDLTREREANRVLAGRLQQGRSELETFKEERKKFQTVFTTPRLFELLDASLEVHSWRRIMASLSSGHSLQESITHEHTLCEALSTSSQDQLTSTGLWDHISSHLGVPLLPPSVAAPRRPSLLPPPTATTHAPFLPPLVDHSLIVGPGWGQTLRLFQSGPAPMAALTRPSAPLPPTSLHAFLTHGGAASYSSHSHTSSPSFNLTPEVLYSSSTPTGSPLPAEPHVLASFCLPEGALVKAVPLETLASKMYGALGMEGGGGESPISLDPLFERPSGGRKGPRGHFFFLTGSLGGGEEKEEEEKDMQKVEDNNGGLSGRPSESFPYASSSSSSSSSTSIDEALGLKRGGLEKQQQGTRYCLCLAVSQVVTLGMVKAMAGGKGEGEGAEGGGSTVTPEYALNLPRVFCVISRHPFFPAHFHYLKALASQWREGLEEQYRAWMGVGRMDVGGEWRAAAAAAAVVVAGSSAEVGATPSSNSATSSHLTTTSTAVVEASSSLESCGATSSSLSEEAGATPTLLSQRWKSLSKVGGGFWNSFSVAMSSASSSSSSSTAVTSLHLAEQQVRRSSIASSSSSSSSQAPGLDPGLDTPSSRLSPPLPPSRFSDREVSKLATHLSHSSRLCPPALNHLIHSYTSLLPPLPGEVLTWAPPLPSTTTTTSIALAHGPVVLRYQRPPPTPPLHPNMDTPRCLAQWALPTLLSLLPPDSLLLLLGAALTEHSVVMVGGGVSYQALTAAVTALPLLLAPLHWTGLHLPLLTPSLHDVLSAPVPFCVGLPELPPTPPHSHQGVGWVQDEETLVVMLESETLRIPALPPPPAANNAPAGVASSGGDGGLGGGDFLSILIPNASTLYEKLKPYFAAFSSPSSPTSSSATTTSGSGSYSSTASTTTSSSAIPLQPPHLIRRPCYPPFTPSQESAVSGIVGVIEGHIEGLISASKGGTAKAEDFPEVEAPFWDRFLNSQALAHTLEARGVRKAAQAMLALGARVGGERAAVEAMAKGMGGGGAGNATSTQTLSHPPPLSSSMHSSPPPTQHSSRPTAHHLPAVPPPRPPPLSFPGAGLGLPSIRSGGGSGNAVAAAASAMAAAPSPRTARKIGAAWRAQGERAPVVRAVMAVRSTARGREEGEGGGREGSVKEGEDEE